MSTREKAYDIFQQLTEEQLNGFVALFGKYHEELQDSPKPVSDGSAVDSIRGILKNIPDIDPKKEKEERLAKYENND